MSPDPNLRLVVEDADAYISYVSNGRDIKVRPEWKKRPGRDLLARAIGFKPGTKLNLLDGTMGLAADAVHLHSLGVAVTAVEQNKIIVDLVQWWLTKNNLSLPVIHADAARWIQNCRERFDVIYLDPMFPTKRSAKSRKSMEALQLLLEDKEDSALLFEAARQKADRVVVKRPLKSPLLALHPEPSFQIKGKTIRYDIFRR